MFRFLLPDLGEGIHEGEILKWHVAEGETVVEDAPLVDIETDKAAVTIPSPRGGRVAKHGGKAGDTVRVGDLLAEIDDGTSPKPAKAEPKRAKAEPEPAKAEPEPAKAEPEPAEGEVEPDEAEPIEVEPAEPAETESEPADGESEPAGTEKVEAQSSGRPVPAAPATRRLARELGVDLSAVAPTGKGGRVLDDDVRNHAEGRGAGSGPQTREPAKKEGASARAPGVKGAQGMMPIPFLDIEPLPSFEDFGPVRREPLRSVRRRTARHMVTSSLIIPHVAHLDEADITELEAVRRSQKDRLGERPGGRLSLLAFVIKALIAGLREHPRFNASVDAEREEMVFKDHFHIGFAADTPRGLLVPVIRDSDRRSILGIATAVEELAERARDGTIQADEMRGGTFTITNIGAMGGTGLIPLINHPEVAILGMGRAEPKAVVRDGQVVVRTMLPLVLAFDHRIADGGDAVRFVNDLVRRLEDPNTLLVEA